MANRAFIRIDGVTIANAATVESCFAVLTASDSDTTGDVNLTLGFADADDPAAPTNITELNALTMTTATVSWSPSQWVDGQKYQTPDLTASAQEVFDRVGWGTGQAMILLIENNSSDSGAYRRFSTFDFDSGSEKPMICFGVEL